MMMAVKKLLVIGKMDEQFTLLTSDERKGEDAIVADKRRLTKEQEQQQSNNDSELK